MSLINLLKFITRHPLNREHKLGSIIRFAKWQFGSRLVPGTVVFDWINGSKILVKTGETGLTGNIYTGLHEFPDMGFLLHFLDLKTYSLILEQMLVHTPFLHVVLLVPKASPSSRFQVHTRDLSKTCASIIWTKK